MKETGKYYLIRCGWSCNICGKTFYTTKKRKPHCNSAPYVFGHTVIQEVEPAMVDYIKENK